MSEILYFKMEELKDTELGELFVILIPEYNDLSCVACGYENEKPIAIIATNNDQLCNILRNYKEGIKELNTSDIPNVKYHLTGNKTLWIKQNTEA